MTYAPHWMLCVALLFGAGTASAQVFEPSDAPDSADETEAPEESEETEASEGSEETEASEEAEASDETVESDEPAPVFAPATPEPAAPAAEPAPAASVAADDLTYRALSRNEFARLERETGLNASAFLSCVESGSAGRRERLVSASMALEVFVEADGSLRVMYRGGEEADATPDNDESVQDCVDTALEGQGTEAASDELRSASFAMSAYSDNFASQRTQRQGEIIGLYTLSGVSLGLGIGSLIAAGGESGGDDEFQSERVADASSSRSREQRFRRAGWTMIGVSTAAFIGAEVLYIRNKRIERDENPWWASTVPVGPNGSLGLNYATRF